LYRHFVHLLNGGKVARERIQVTLPEQVRILATRLFDRLDVSDPGTGDLLFQIFGAGNAITGPDRPFERFRYYEALLRHLKDHGPERYGLLHKGTAFWFLSWLAFDLRNYQKALFYMDAALSEDVRRAPTVWLTEPAGRFLTLSDTTDVGVGQHIRRLRELLDQQVQRFNRSSGEPLLTIADMLSGFVTTLVQEPRHRTIVSAWYFYILEFEERAIDLELRSTSGGSIAPFLDHLFRGGLLLESVLKTLYLPGPGAFQTLGAIFKQPRFQADFGKGFLTSSDDLTTILNSPRTTPMFDAFSTTARLRNTTGHNLVWDDQFSDPDSFRWLYEREIDAMLFVVSKRFRCTTADPSATGS
jgi:hypothetical protein